MSLMFPLSGKQKTIWSLRWKGNSPSEIASELGTSRQYVHQVLLAAESKVSRTLLEVAQGANLQIKKVDPKNGVLLAYDPILKSNSVITYTNKNGIRIWHWYDRIEDIKDQSYADEVRNYLLNEADERGIKLTEEERNLHPARLARLVFGKLIQGLG